MGSTVDPSESPELEPAPEPQRERFVLFTIGVLHCAFRMEVVQQVIQPTAITRVPAVPAFIKGVTNLRGRILPVVDLCARLGIEPTPSGKPRIVVVQTDHADVGYLVDSVGGSAYHTSEEIHEPPADSPPGSIPRVYIESVIQEEEGGDETIVLDVEAMIRAERGAMGQA